MANIPIKGWLVASALVVPVIAAMVWLVALSWQTSQLLAASSASLDRIERTLDSTDDTLKLSREMLDRLTR